MLAEDGLTALALRGIVTGLCYDERSRTWHLSLDGRTSSQLGGINRPPPHLLAGTSTHGSQQTTGQHHRAQLRHADGGALAQRVYIHQLPQTAPRLAGVIEAVFAPKRMLGGRCRLGVGRRDSQPSSPT